MTGSDHYSIPKEPGGRGALVLAVIVHLALVVFLWIGVSWQSKDGGGVEAEVWDTQYREAAPKQPEPVQEEKTVAKPEPKPVEKPVEKAQIAKVDIALEQEKKRKEEAKKKEEEKRKQELLDQKNRDQLRNEEMRRIAGGSGGSGSAPKSTGNNRLDPGYARMIGTKIRSNTSFVIPDSLDENSPVEYAIELLPDGTLRTRPRKLKSSSLSGFDDAVLRAIEKSVPFPPDRSGKVPSSFVLIHKPKG